MTITEKDILDRIIDLKNCLLFGKWTAEQVIARNKEQWWDEEDDPIYEGDRAAINLFLFGLLCLPINWTASPEVWLRAELIMFDNDVQPLKKELKRGELSGIELGRIEQLNYFKQQLKSFIDAKNDKSADEYIYFNDDILSSNDQKMYLKTYLDILNHYDSAVQKWLFPIEEEIRLIILSMLN